jgi:hypothetical protein
MIPRILIFIGLTALVSFNATFAQQPNLEVTVTKTPGGKGRVVGYNSEKKLLLVELTLANGKTTQVTASRQFVNAKSWHELSGLLDRGAAPQTTGDAVTFDRAAPSGARNTQPIEVRTKLGDQGRLISYDVDSNTVQLDFDGRQGHPIAIQQLQPESWQAAKQQLASRFRRRAETTNVAE